MNNKMVHIFILAQLN